MAGTRDITQKKTFEKNRLDSMDYTSTLFTFQLFIQTKVKIVLQTEDIGKLEKFVATISFYRRHAQSASNAIDKKGCQKTSFLCKANTELP